MSLLPSPIVSKSPLRYPGGKSRAARAIARYIPEGEPRLCSPFFGGGSVELELARRMEVSGFDIFEPLVSFWEELLNRPHELAENVRRFYPLSRESFYILQEALQDVTNSFDRAAIFFVLNRSSFSGVTLSGGMSPGHPRFTESAIERLETFQAAARLSVSLGDFRDVIPSHSGDFLYLDPPYWIPQALYGIKGDNHKRFDHFALYNLLSKRNRWVLSYNDSPQVRELYKGYKIETLSWAYGMGNNKRSREVIILSEEAE